MRIVIITKEMIMMEFFFLPRMVAFGKSECVKTIWANLEQIFPRFFY